MIARPQVHRNVGNVLAIDQHPAGVGRDQADNDVEAGGLAGAVRPQQPDHFTLLDMETDAVDYPSSAVAFADLVSR